MTTWIDGPVTVLVGDILERLRELPDASVHCVVTSPPYFGLRDYGTAEWEGGEQGCDHVFVPDAGATTQRVGRSYQQGHPHRDCPRCGARRVDQQLGLEPTPELYIEHMVGVFREIRRVLRPDGTCWVNLGDSYASSPPGNKGTGVERYRGSGLHNGNISEAYAATLDRSASQKRNTIAPGLKPKDLVGIPWRVALALQADGWWLRQCNIWSKPNPMPESVTDRPTTSHEYIFELAQSGSPTFWTHRDGYGSRTQPPPDWRWQDRLTGEEVDVDPGDSMRWQRVNLWRGHDYFYDAEAVREPNSETAGALAWRRIFDPAKQDKEAALKAAGLKGGNDGAREYNPAGRNLRSVWTIATQPYPEAHFATYPEELVRRCIAAGTSEHGCCPACGAPWRRVTSTEYVKSPVHGNGSVVGRHYATGQNNYDGAAMPRVNKAVTTTGWQPTCRCEAGECYGPNCNCAPGHCGRLPIPAVVLDPFAGSGTTLAVARRMGRRSIGIELQPQYLPLIQRRVQEAALPMLEEPEPETISLEQLTFLGEGR